ncbi:MAG: ribonuclease E/G [Devosiaceae bacterium]|nr:ribonuclease E/G [Devosiaceae bacterium]
MSSDILINSAIGETRLAHMENGKPVEIRLFRDNDQSLIGAIYYGRVTSLSQEFQAAFVDLGNGITGFLPLKLLPKRAGKKPADLTSLLHEGQKIITQVTADAIGDKSVKLTCRIEVVSSALILHPFREGAFVSSRIKNPARREELKAFGNSLNLRGMGLTLRTEAEYIPLEDLKKTAEHLIRHWVNAAGNRDKKKVPSLLSQAPDSLLQILREYGSSKHDRIIFDQPSALKLAQIWAREFAPNLLGCLQRHQGPAPLFEDFSVEEDLDQIFEKKIPLPSGAWITIEQTEATVVVDVNMGNAKVHTDPQKQRFSVNASAAREIFRQIRLRGLSGLIIIDFINMSGQNDVSHKTPTKSDISNLLGIVDNLILEDPTQIQRSNMSAFGLLELTRKSRHRSLSRQILSETSPAATVETAALALLRQSEQDAAAKPGIALSVVTKPAVRDWITARPHLLNTFTRRTGSKLEIKEE